MTFTYIFVILIAYFLIMSIDDTDKWASQIIDELLEKLEVVDKNINSIVKQISNKYPSTRKASSLKEVDISTDDSKMCESCSIDALLKIKDESDISYQTCEAEYIIPEVSDTIFEDKVNSQDDFTSASNSKVINMCKTASASLGPLDKLRNSPDKLKDIYKTDSGSGEFKVNDLDDKDSVILVHNSPKFNGLKDIQGYIKNNFIQANSPGTDKTCYKRDESCQKVYKVESNPPREYFESEISQSSEELHDLERVDQKVRSIQFGTTDGNVREAYNKWFYENFIREEIEFRRIDEDENLPENEINGMGTSTDGDLINPHESKKYLNSIQKTTKVVSNVGKGYETSHNQNNVIHQKGKIVDSMATQLKRENKCLKGGVHEKLKNIYETNKEYHRYRLKHFERDINLGDLAKVNTMHSTINSSNETIHEDLMDLNQISTKNISIQLKPTDVSQNILPNKSLKDYRVVVKDPIREQVFNVTTTYQNTCRMFEDLALKPITLLTSEIIDVLIFVFFLLVSVFYSLYRSINVQRFTHFFKKSEKFPDITSNSKKWTQQENFVNNSLSSNRITIEDVKNYEPRRTESWHSFCYEDEHFSKEDQINVTPENVCILDSACEYAKQNLDDLYKNGSNFCEYLCNTTVVIKPCENSLVDIILKNCGQKENVENENDSLDIENKAFDVSDPDLPIGRNSNESFESNVNSSEISVFANDTENISCIEKNLEHPPHIMESDTNDSYFVDFSIFTDNKCKNILNSTEIDNSNIEIKSKSASNLCKVLSPSEINIFDGLHDIYQPSESSSSECLRNSYSSISANSFALLIPRKNNLPSLQTSTSSEETSELFLDERPDRCRETCIQNQSEACGESLKECLETNLKSMSEYSDSSSHFSEIGDGEIYKCNTLLENSFVIDNPESSLNVTTANTVICNEVYSLMDRQQSTASDFKAPKRRKNTKLTRRVSDILNYCRRMNLIQIVSRKKKYDKQIVSKDLFNF